jgi:hypothetical protein
MKPYLTLALASLIFSSCEVTPYGPGVTTVGVGVGYYDTLPSSWNHPYYYYGNRYYYGGAWQPGRYYHRGRYYDGRYHHSGRYYYGGRYSQHGGHYHRR